MILERHFYRYAMINNILILLKLSIDHLNQLQPFKRFFYRYYCFLIIIIFHSQIMNWQSIYANLMCFHQLLMQKTSFRLFRNCIRWSNYPKTLFVLLLMIKDQGRLLCASALTMFSGSFASYIRIINCHQLCKRKNAISIPPCRFSHCQDISGFLTGYPNLFYEPNRGNTAIISVSMANRSKPLNQIQIGRVKQRAPSNRNLIPALKTLIILSFFNIIRNFRMAARAHNFIGPCYFHHDLFTDTFISADSFLLFKQRIFRYFYCMPSFA